MASTWLRKTIEELERQGLYRRTRVLESTTGRTARWKGRELVNFASNNYLGLTHHPQVVEAAATAARTCGTGAGASRMISGTIELHERLERALAAFKGTESALVFPTGYMAAMGTIVALAEGGRLLLMDKLNHASLIDGGRLAERTHRGTRLRTYPHGNLDRLAALLDREAGQRSNHDPGVHSPLIVTDGLFSMDGDLADLSALCALAREHDAAVMVDEAHATGVIGRGGRGVCEHLGVEEAVEVHMGTFSKALGAMGGYIAGGRDLIDFLRNRARTFIYTTALPPPVVAAALAAIEVVRSEEGAALREQVLALAARLREALLPLDLDAGASASQIVPIVLGDNDRTVRVAESLLERGFLLGAIRPPTVPAGTARLRVGVSAAHEPEDIEKFVTALKESL